MGLTENTGGILQIEEKTLMSKKKLYERNSDCSPNVKMMSKVLITSVWRLRGRIIKTVVALITVELRM